MKARNCIPTLAEEAWNFCYDIAYQFRNMETGAQTNLFYRAQSLAQRIEEQQNPEQAAGIRGGLAAAKDWKRGDL